MARFCVKCRSSLDPDAKFCDACGAPVRVRKPAAAVAQPATPVPRRVSAAAPGMEAPVDINLRKVALLSGVSVAVLVVAGAVAAFLAMPSATPSASDLAALLNVDAVKVADSLVKGEHGWQIDNGIATAPGLNLQTSMQSPTGIGSPSRGGLLRKLTSMFSGLFGSKPVLEGKWSDDSGAFGTLEFTANRVVMHGQSVPITYEDDSADNKRIRVVTSGGMPVATIELIDDNHFYLSLGFGKARFHRLG